jgi:8-oxo-dGTP diphosphatase
LNTSTAAIISDGDQVLFVKRPSGGDLGGLWELPGGKVDPGETPESALVRELSEELSIAASVDEPAGGAHFLHRGEAFELQAFFVSADLSTLQLHEHTELCWSTPRGALELDLAPSDRALLENMLDAG